MNNKSDIVKSLCTISEMLTDRGVPDVEKYIRFGEDEAAILSNRLFHIDVESANLRIIFTNSKFKFAEIKAWVKPEINSYMIVSKEKANANELKKLDDVMQDYQVFELKDLTFNISKHRFVPKHELITDREEHNKIIAAYQIKTISQLPLILKTDPMARYINAKAGSVVKITRYSPTSGEHVVYRCCV